MPTKKISSKYKAGDIVLVAKTVDADLEGVKLFPQYKKGPYTVESYDAATGVYTLRRQNLLLKLMEQDIVAPGEKSDNMLTRKQY